MLNHSFARRIASFLCTLALVLAFAAPAAATVLADSSVTDSWKLANGLEVRLRHIPRASGVAIVVAYRAGTGYDSAKRHGLAALLAELQFTSAAGDIPERTSDEMDSIRPLGWSVRTNERLALLTEISSPEQFPAVLRQVATRMRGVTLTPAGLKEAIASLRREQSNFLFGRADLGLYYRVRSLALQTPDELLVSRASGAELKSLTVKEALEQLGRLYVPANASLAIAGDLRDLDVRKLVEHEFGGIPGGTAQPELPEPSLRPAARALSFPGLERSVGVVGVFAPSLDDSLHPAFYLNMMGCGAWFTNTLGRPAEPLTSRFQYSLFDEPDMVRFYPQIRGGETATGELARYFNGYADQFAEATIEVEALDTVRRSVAWMLGGTMASGTKAQIRQQPGALGTMAANMAARAIWRGDEFWNRYLQRFEATHRGHRTFSKWIVDPANQAALLFTAKP